MHWYWVITISDKIFATIYQEYWNILKQIEMKINLKIKYLRRNDEKEYKRNFISILKKLRIKYKITNLYSSQSNEKIKFLNWILQEYIKMIFYQVNIFLNQSYYYYNIYIKSFFKWYN